MNPVNWFEIPVVDLSRAKSFYEGVFGLSLTLENLGPFKMAFFPMENNVYGATGSLMKADGYIPSRTGIAVYFSVEDIEGTLAKAVKAGGKVMTSKMGIGQYGFIGHFEDTEGNRIGLHSMK
ncbi:MAG: VOC family protein [Deltaproteobacteria bacterium]|nr:VOC family protein [Deltaproteobacteria bacterium]